MIYTNSWTTLTYYLRDCLLVVDVRVLLTVVNRDFPQAMSLDLPLHVISDKHEFDIPPVLFGTLPLSPYRLSRSSQKRPRNAAGAAAGASARCTRQRFLA
jgi:hypothetical protein